MKANPFHNKRAVKASGFTLIELLVVMAIIAILATLSLGAFRYAQESAARNRTSGALAAIRASLEQYKEKFGEYPEARNPEQVTTFRGKTFRVGGALMLYQAITGDGSDHLRLGSSSASPSDGSTDATELKDAINPNLPKQMILGPISSGYILVDGFGHPIQYDKAGTTGSSDTVNPTYDLWSYGNIDSGKTPASDRATKTSELETGTWIKNW